MRVVLTTGTLMIGRVSRTTLAFRSCAAALNVSRLHSTRAVPRATVIILMLRPPFPAQTAPALPRIKWPCAAIDTTYSEVTSTRGAGGAFLLMHLVVKAVVVWAMVNLFAIFWMLW